MRHVRSSASAAEAEMHRQTLLKCSPALALVALASCGARDAASQRANGGPAVENATLTKLSLTSTAFADGQAIPAQYTCDGAGQSPPLKWGEPPQRTKSFALVVDDPDAPSGLFRHWGAYDIPPTTRAIGQGESIGRQAVNDFGKPGYGGPCPPPGHGPHHYHFKLYALDVDKLGVSPGAKVKELESAVKPHMIGVGELVGIYERK
ncbi:MAG: YbhB/YbcL family Raf kinase inhibitor-like protein [Sphingomonas sp.]